MREEEISDDEILNSHRMHKNSVIDDNMIVLDDPFGGKLFGNESNYRKSETLASSGRFGMVR